MSCTDEYCHHKNYEVENLTKTSFLEWQNTISRMWTLNSSCKTQLLLLLCFDWWTESLLACPLCYANHASIRLIALTYCVLSQAACYITSIDSLFITPLFKILCVAWWASHQQPSWCHLSKHNNCFKNHLK